MTTGLTQTKYLILITGLIVFFLSACTSNGNDNSADTVPRSTVDAPASSTQTTPNVQTSVSSEGLSDPQGKEQEQEESSYRIQPEADSTLTEGAIELPDSGLANNENDKQNEETTDFNDLLTTPQAPVDAANEGDIELKTDVGSEAPTVEESQDSRVGVEVAPTLATTTTQVIVNGLQLDEIVLMPTTTRRNVQEIYRKGQELGRDPNVFSKLGSSTIATPQYLTHFERGQYDLGRYRYLQKMIDYFDGSFERYGVAVKEGLTAWAIFSPDWLDMKWCFPEESLAECEIRLNNPSILVIVVGTNDIAEESKYVDNMRHVVELAIESGVIPILTTKADRYEGSNRNNNLLRDIAAEYRVPLLDFDIIAATLPNRGLSGDEVHMTYYDEYNYSEPDGFERGYGMLNLTTLMALDAVWQEMLAAEDVELDQDFHLDK